jgi:hypothetical protein
MAILDPLHPVQSNIVEILIVRRALSVSEIHEELKKEYFLSVSSANLYRVIAQLIEKQVLTRISGQISLNLVWVTHFLKFARILEEQFNSEGSQIVRLPVSEGEEKKFNEESLVALDPIWNDILMTLARERVDEVFWGFNSHAWYSISTKNTEQNLYQGLEALGICSKMVIGHNTFLDGFGTRMMSPGAIEIVMRSSSSLPMALRSDNLVLWVAGPYIAECRLPHALSTLFSFFFKSVFSADEFDIQAFCDLFRVRARCTISLRKSFTEASFLRNLLQEATVQNSQSETALVHT